MDGKESLPGLLDCPPPLVVSVAKSGGLDLDFDWSELPYEVVSSTSSKAKDAFATIQLYGDLPSMCSVTIHARSLAQTIALDKGLEPVKRFLHLQQPDTKPVIAWAPLTEPPVTSEFQFRICNSQYDLDTELLSVREYGATSLRIRSPSFPDTHWVLTAETQARNAYLLELFRRCRDGSFGSLLPDGAPLATAVRPVVAWLSAESIPFNPSIFDPRIVTRDEIPKCAFAVVSDLGECGFEIVDRTSGATWTVQSSDILAEVSCLLRLCYRQSWPRCLPSESVETLTYPRLTAVAKMDLTECLVGSPNPYPGRCVVWFWRLFDHGKLRLVEESGSGLSPSALRLAALVRAAIHGLMWLDESEHGSFFDGLANLRRDDTWFDVYPPWKTGAPPNFQHTTDCSCHLIRQFKWAIEKFATKSNCGLPPCILATNTKPKTWIESQLKQLGLQDVKQRRALAKAFDHACTYITRAEQELVLHALVAYAEDPTA